jgi:hypothetical protein
VNDGPLEAVGNKVGLRGLEIPAGEADPVELLKQLDEIGESLRQLIVQCKRLPKDKSLAPHQESGRSLSQAQVQLQTGFMWLRRAIESPKVF